MDQRIFNFLKNYGYDTNKIDCIIVSAFLAINKIEIKKNVFLKKFTIDNTNKSASSLEKIIFLINETNANKFDLENLLELFEFVVSPADKIVNGAIYTPLKIREYIINETILSRAHKPNIRIADIACGCAGFLMTTANFIKRLTNRKYSEIISENLFGLDITEYSIQRSKIVLSLLALMNGEDIDLTFNLFVGNALDFNWRKKIRKINQNDGFDIIVGNPPYVCSRNIDIKSLELLANWEVTKSGHPDLYIPFFQVAIENLNQTGILGYITVNTFFKSVNGRALREYFSKNRLCFKIIDFRNEQVFKKRNTYTCICIISKLKSNHIKFCIASSNSLKDISESNFSNNYYDDFDDSGGWNLGKASAMSVINKIESFDTKIFPEFSFSTGIATLKNNIYKFKPIKSDNTYYYLKSRKEVHKIEKKICRDIINSNKVTTEKHIKSLKEKIIFPYQWNPLLNKYTTVPEIELKEKFPKTYQYLSNNKNELANRDKGETSYENWYEYGRSQGLHIKGIKLLLPHITNNPSFVLSNDKKLLFCNGEAIISDSERQLKILKKILESQIFWFYIVKTSKPYSSNYFSLGKNYLKKFSIPKLTKQEETFLIKTKSKVKILEFLLKEYDLKQDEINLD